jgi:hypothetical protein
MTRLYQYIINIFITTKKEGQNEKLIRGIKEYDSR